MSSARVLVLAGGSPRHLFVVNALCEAANVVAIVQETGGEWNVRKVLKSMRPDRLWRKAWRWLRDRRRYTGNGEAEFFFGTEQPRLDCPDRLEEVPHINHPDVVSLADRLEPDLIAVFGVSLIRGELLNRGKHGIVNLHGGLSPEYRGADCTFWALYNREPDKVGCTLHYIDPGIDTGRLIAHISPEVRPDDDELTLFWRGVKESAGVYAEFIRRHDQGERFGAVQPAKGRLYQVKQRGLKHERVVDRLLAEGLLDNVKLERRVTWYEAEGRA